MGFDQAPGAQSRAPARATPARRANLLLATLATLVSLCLGEAALRWLDPLHRVPVDPPMRVRLAYSAQIEVQQTTQGNIFGTIQPSDSETVYVLKPGRTWLFEGAAARTNSAGFRGPEWSPRRDGDALRVVGVGDSVMFGWGVAEEQTFMGLLAARLGGPQPDGGRAVEVLNGAVPGYNALQEAALVERRLMAYQPDLLLLGYTQNDHEEASFASPGPLEEQALRSYLFAALCHVLERPWLGPRRVSRAFARLGRVARAAGVPVLFFVYPKSMPGFGPELPRRMGLREGFRQVDIETSFREWARMHGGNDLEGLTLSAKDAHPNPQGHELIARSLEGPLREALRALPTRAASAGR
jgi:lysophospholipase L1-like esterase